MQVKIVPVSGCLQVFLRVITLGVAPVMAWINERNWPGLVDEQGLVTRGGTRIAWNEFTGITKVFTKIGSTRAEYHELASPKGRVVVAAYRLVSGEQVLNYIWQRLPERAKQAHA